MYRPALRMIHRITTQGLRGMSTKCQPTSVAYVWGDGASGALGPLEDNSVNEPTRQDFGVKLVQLVAGGSKVHGIDAEGNLYSWGSCDHYSLGLGPESVGPVELPTKIDVLDGIPIKQVATGAHHSAAISEEGDLYTWGSGSSSLDIGISISFLEGQGGLGHGDKATQPSPALVEFFSDAELQIKDVAVGDRHTIALASDGQVYTWGNGEYGRLGHGGNSSLALPRAVDFLEDMNIKRVYAGAKFSAVLEENGNLWAWGKNDQSQLGLGETLAFDVNTMEAFPSLIEKLKEQVVDIACGRYHMVALTKDNSVYFWGAREFLEPQRMSSLDGLGVKQLAANETTSAVVTEAGELWTWGKGIRGKAKVLGHNKMVGNKVPQVVEALEGHNVACVAPAEKFCIALVNEQFCTQSLLVL